MTMPMSIGRGVGGGGVAEGGGGGGGGLFLCMTTINYSLFFGVI